MNEVTVTWGRAIKVWWSLLWRAILYSILAGLIVGIFVAIFGAILGIDSASSTGLSGIFGFLVGIPIGIWVIKIVLQKKYSDFRIALVQVG